MESTNKEIFMYLDKEEEKRVLSHFYSKLEQVIKDNDLMRYNEPTNSLNEVYKIVAEKAQLIMIPENLTNVNDLYEFNILQSNHAQDRLIWTYVQEHFDKLNK